MAKLAKTETDKKEYFCETCHKTMKGTQFYSSNNEEKYGDNDCKLHQCKQCITMMVDNWDPNTYKWILKEADVPYVPDEWNKLMRNYAQDPSKVTGTTIVGRYLAKMKLKKWKDYRWKDSEFLQELEANRMKTAMAERGYSAQEIAEAINDSVNPIVPPPRPEPAQVPVPSPQDQDIVDDIDLTDEDRTYLRLKWGRIYKPEEWVKLEQLYNDMCESYDIQTAGHIDTLKLICKTSLKANQLIDLGDIEGFQKMSKVYDTLMKSGKFTAAQNKAENGEFVDSISELVVLCESEGFIPRFYIDKPNDKVDETLQDLKDYTYSLVTEEMNLGNLIDNAVKEMTRQEEQEEDEDEDEELTLEDLDNIKNQEINDNDFEEYNNFLEDETNDTNTAILKVIKESKDETF